MKYKCILVSLCIFGTTSLYAHESGLGDVLRELGKEKIPAEFSEKKSVSKKKRRFVFRDDYEANGIGEKDKNRSESYNYTNRSRFKFKFKDGSSHNNFSGGYRGSGGGRGRR
ncbi:hypothetical protein ACM66Z_05175 [Sulfurovum sp. ST-21]|uniref:Uncharacterized protein n=1 Tax=Sulfurovum indicum TaxID=2779528 RepID=A0A7M1S793_9BACT|nr:hypothetical protein [Sulfurovum indicum]QOR62851.1 hypothetical protein IMZ28_05140 [Sulfurovum indicum]